jgi:hypothetical protein
MQQIADGSLFLKQRRLIWFDTLPYLINLLKNSLDRLKIGADL